MTSLKAHNKYGPLICIQWWKIFNNMLNIKGKNQIILIRSERGIYTPTVIIRVKIENEYPNNKGENK